MVKIQMQQTQVADEKQLKAERVSTDAFFKRHSSFGKTNKSYQMSNATKRMLGGITDKRLRSVFKRLMRQAELEKQNFFNKAVVTTETVTYKEHGKVVRDVVAIPRNKA